MAVGAGATDSVLGALAWRVLCELAKTMGQTSNPAGEVVHLQTARRWWHCCEEEGATSIEYVLIAAVVVIVIIATVQAIGVKVSQPLATVGAAFP